VSWIRTAIWLTVFVVAVGLTACGGAGTDDTDEAAAKIPITTSSDEARSSFLQGRQLLDDLRFTDAHQFFVASVETDPDFAFGWLRVANTSATAQDFFDALRRAVESSATVSDGEKKQIRAFEAGVNGEPAAQRAELEALVAAYPGDERAHNAYAIYLFGQQEYEPAIIEYRAAIDINSDFARIALWQGDLGAASELAANYRETVVDHSIRFEVRQSHELNGMVALAEGNFDTALDELAQANQQNPQVLLLTARTHAAAGDSDAARQACEQVIDFNQLSFNLAYVRNTARELLEEL